jgi:ABC-type antimicrobial peptide transport system permease subunit
MENKQFEKQYRNSKIIGIIFFIIAGISLIVFIYYLINLSLTTHSIKDVPCYDRFSNVIQGLTCKEDETNSYAMMMVFPGTFLIGIILFIGLSFYNKYEV